MATYPVLLLKDELGRRLIQMFHRDLMREGLVVVATLGCVVSPLARALGQVDGLLHHTPPESCLFS